MNRFKTYILSVIITSVVLQISNLILKNTKFNKFHNCIGSIIMITILFSPLFSISDISFEVLPAINQTDFSELQADAVFCKKLENVINEDLNSKGYLNCDAKVSTDWNSLGIVIYCENEINDEKELEKYIRDKYCTSKDEVNFKIDG